MSQRFCRRGVREKKSEALAVLATEVFGGKTFDAVRTGSVGIVATRWFIERPMIFKDSLTQADGRTGTFSPGFGCTIGDAVQASCSIYPFFERKILTTDTGDRVEADRRWLLRKQSDPLRNRGCNHGFEQTGGRFTGVAPDRRKRSIKAS